MNRYPNALAETDLGQEIRDIVAETRDYLLIPLNGVGKSRPPRNLPPFSGFQRADDLLDFSNHRPQPGMHTADYYTRQLWALHTQANANDAITQIITINIMSINHVLARLAIRNRAIRQRAFELVHLSTLPTTPAAWLQAENANTVALMVEHEAWEEILGLELQMSREALQRMEMAREGHFHVYEARRLVLRGLVRRVNELSGNGDFLLRHGNELWDTVLA